MFKGQDIVSFSLIFRGKIIKDAYKSWILPSDRVLDIGCGNAVVSDELRKGFGCEIVCTDVLDYRKRDVSFRLMKGKDKLPFNNGEFDTCVFNDALHHCEHQVEILNEASRVARRILIFEMEPTFIARLLDIMINQIHNRKMPIPLNIKSSQEWRNYFKGAGFDFEFRRIKRPFFYPFINFAIKLERQR